MMKNICHDTTKPNEISIFKGLLKCGDCSHAMRKRWDKHTTKTGETHRYLYYNCSTFRDFAKAAKGLPDEEKARLPICTSHYISDKVLQKMILEDINLSGWKDSDTAHCEAEVRDKRGQQPGNSGERYFQPEKSSRDIAEPDADGKG